MGNIYSGGDDASEYGSNEYQSGYGQQQTGQDNDSDKLQTNRGKKKPKSRFQVEGELKWNLRFKLSMSEPGKRRERTSPLDPYTTFLLVSFIAMIFEVIAYFFFGKVFSEILSICWLLFFLVTSLIVTYRGTRRW